MIIKNVAQFMRIAGRSPRDITFFDDDVFIVSYPKSGNTWCRFLVGNLVSENTDISFANIEMIAPDIYLHNNRYLMKIRRPRILKSHECFHPKYRKTIYLIRDPRAVAVSYYHYLTKYVAQFARMDLTTFVGRFLVGGLDNFGTWGQHVGSWYWEIQSRETVLLLKYEDLLRDTEKELSKIAKFLGAEITHEKLADTIRASSFDEMRALENRQPGQMRRARSCKRGDNAAFVRQGKAEGWREALSKSNKEMIESVWGRLMQEFGYL